MQVVKLHGAGNDYIVLEGRGKERDWSTLARAICHRHLGVGADGIAVVLSSQVADLRMRIFNPDGSEAEMSGNGIRCFTKFVLDRDMVTLKGQELLVETLAGIRRVTPTSAAGKVVRARVAMGQPRLKPWEVPVDPSQRLVQIGARPSTGQRHGPRGTEYFNAKDEMVLDWPVVVEGRELRVTGVSLGNPHAVAFLEGDVAGFPLGQLGPQVEHHPLFPQRVNFEVANVLDRGHLRARIWERGAQETLASGTGACAIAVAARLHGYTGDLVDITLPGGVLRIQWDGQGEVVLEGPVQEVFEGEWRETL